MSGPSAQQIADLRAQVIAVTVSLVKARADVLQVLLADLEESDGDRRLSATIVQAAIDFRDT